MQKRPKSQKQISWDPSAKSADFVTFANDWLSFSPHHSHRQTFPALRKSSHTLDWPSFNGSAGVAPYANVRSPSPCHHVLYESMITVGMAGLMSAGCRTPQETDVSDVSSRANRAYSRRVLLLNLKHLHVVFGSRVNAAWLLRQPGRKRVTYSPSSRRASKCLKPSQLSFASS